jgi:hypothetical protein
MQYTKEEKILHVSKSWKAYYGVLSQKEISDKLEYMKRLNKDDVNTLAKIKALEELKK